MDQNINRVVWIDMDNTMFDFDTAALTSVPEELRVAKSNFYIANDYPEPFRSQIIATYTTPGFFKELTLLPGVIEGWHALLGAGYHPRVLSSPLASNATCVEDKLDSLQRYLVPEFGEWVVEEAVLDTKSGFIPGLALLDDKPDARPTFVEKSTASWTHILYNWKHISGKIAGSSEYRFTSWEKPDDLIAILSKISSSSDTMQGV